MLTIGCGLVLGFSGQALKRCLALGIVLYLAYIVYIGGDFMGGRFFTIPLLLAAALTAGTELRKPRLRLVTRGPLFEAARIREILKINTGRSSWATPAADEYFDGYEWIKSNLDIPAEPEAGLGRQSPEAE